MPSDSVTLSENPEREVCTPSSISFHNTSNIYPESNNSPERSMISGVSPENMVEQSGIFPESMVERSNEEQTGKYSFPSRSTRGIPPRRYDPEFEAQRSKYPVNKISEGNLSQITKAYNATIYSETIPTTTEEALRNLAYAVGVVSRFMHKPQKQHLEAVYRILRHIFNVDIKSKFNLPNLKKLSIQVMPFECEFWGKLIASCPSLEDLSFMVTSSPYFNANVIFTEMTSISILGQNLLRLNITVLHDHWAKVVIDAPRLEYLMLNIESLSEFRFAKNPNALCEAVISVVRKPRIAPNGLGRM
uniref:Uncharacterized protein n=1 Tax=Chenopodium quinoa TaxID=63459 RepID=A0A803L5P2_CHEQI